MSAEEYKRLISRLKLVIGNKETLDKMKDIFADSIDSQRVLHSIRTIGCLVEILDLRDAINEHDISDLETFFKPLYNSDECDNEIKSCYELINCYNKLHGPEVPVETCTVCAAPKKRRKLFKDNSSVNVPAAVDDNNNLVCLQDAIMRLKDHLNGESWSRLGRQLQLKEGKMRQFEKEMECQRRPRSEIIKEMLDLWAKERTATIEQLESALQHKWVFRRDLIDKLRD